VPIAISIYLDVAGVCRGHTLAEGCAFGDGGGPDVMLMPGDDPLL